MHVLLARLLPHIVFVCSCMGDRDRDLSACAHAMFKVSWLALTFVLLFLWVFVFVLIVVSAMSCDTLNVLTPFTEFAIF